MIQKQSDRLNIMKHIDNIPLFHGIHKWHHKMSTGIFEKKAVCDKAIRLPIIFF